MNKKSTLQYIIKNQSTDMKKMRKNQMKRHESVLLLLWVACLLAGHWIEWMKYVALVFGFAYLALVVIRPIVDYRHTRIYLMTQRRETWQRYKRIYRTQLTTERIILCMFTIFTIAVIFGIIING